jgi:hypothetical protein
MVSGRMIQLIMPVLEKSDSAEWGGRLEQKDDPAHCKAQKILANVFAGFDSFFF